MASSFVSAELPRALPARIPPTDLFLLQFLHCDTAPSSLLPYKYWRLSCSPFIRSGNGLGAIAVTGSHLCTRFLMSTSPTVTSPSSPPARSFRNALCFHYCAALVLVSLTLLTNTASTLQLSL